MGGSNLNRKKLLLGICMGLGLLSLGFVYVKWPHKVAADPARQTLYSTEKKFASLPLLMESGMQHEYDFLSSTLTGGVAMDERRMNAVSTSAGRMDNLARELGSYEHDLRLQSKSGEDIKFFRETTLSLDRISQDLQDAALRQDTTRMTNAFRQMDQTCVDCHTRFAVKAVVRGSGKKK